MDMGSHGLRHIDWSPYEEDTAEKYQILLAETSGGRLHNLQLQAHLR